MEDLKHRCTLSEICLTFGNNGNKEPLLLELNIAEIMPRLYQQVRKIVLLYGFSVLFEQFVSMHP